MCIFLPSRPPSLLLPIEMNLDSLFIDNPSSLKPSTTSDYIPTLFAFWGLSNNNAIIDAIILEQLADIAKHGLIEFTGEQLDIIFTCGLVSFNLPGAENKQTSLNADFYKLVEVIHHFLTI